MRMIINHYSKIAIASLLFAVASIVLAILLFRGWSVLFYYALLVSLTGIVLSMIALIRCDLSGRRFAVWAMIFSVLVLLMLMVLAY